MDLFIYELKRRLFTKYVLFSMLATLIITIGLNFIIVNDQKDIAPRLQEEAVYEGKIKEENLLLALRKVRDEKSEEQRYNSQVFIIENLIKNYPGILYEDSKIENYPDKYAKEFYNCWRSKFKMLIRKLPTSQQQSALKKLNKVKNPFTQYPGYYLYYTALENIQVLFIFILFLVTFFSSGTYSESFEDESMEIISATKDYKKDMIIRILPVIFYGILLTMIAALGTVGMISSVVGLKALKSSFKMIALFSFGNFSIGQGIIVMVLAEIIGILAISTLMGYISFKTKKTTTAIALGVGLNVFCMIGSKVFSSSTKFMKYLLNAIPMASSQVPFSLNGFSINLGMWEPYAIMLEISVVFVLSSIILVVSIKMEEN
ncbi:hypothetical protein ACFIJ5_08105 [Haloimpatiens sp. FM7330]|uniref:hypothetical protein n=1 Tax=Haloimpatiens sp. FM7330 TaxID=3298610 RepID=UPI0036420E5D